MLVFELTLALRYLAGRKLRSFLTTLAIMFGAVVVFCLNMLVPTMLQVFEINMLAAAGQVDVTINHKTGEMYSRRMLNRVRGLTGVRAVSASLARVINIPDDFFGEAGVSVLTLRGIDPRDAQTLRSYTVAEGRFLRSSDEAVAVISSSLADTLGLKLGDKLHIPLASGIADLRIVGLLSARTLAGNEEVLVTLMEAQKLLDVSDRINIIEINLAPGDKTERDAVMRSIQATVGDDYALGGLSSGSDIVGALEASKAALDLIGFLALFMGGFIILNTFRTIVAERRHDFGMLRAIGASRGTIIWLILVEGVLQRVVGTAAGIALGYLAGAAIIALLGSAMSTFVHIEISIPAIEPSLILTTVGLGVGVTLLAGLLPALSTNRITPIEAMRPAAEPAPRVAVATTLTGAALIFLSLLILISGDNSLAAIGGLMFLLGLVLIAPFLVRPIASVFGALFAAVFARDATGELAQVNMLRQPSRAAITASTTMVGLAIIVGVAGMIFSMTDVYLDILQRSLGSDFLLIPPSIVWKSNIGAKPALAARLRSISGVGVVSTMRYAAATARGQEVALLGIDPVVFPRVSSLSFQAGSAKAAFDELANGRALIINGVFASSIGLKVGEMVQLSTPTGVFPYRVAGIASDFLNADFKTAYTSLTSLQTDFHKNEDIFIQINLLPGVDSTVVEPRLKAALSDYPQFRLISGIAYYEENKQMFESVFALYYAMLGALALPSLIAMLSTLAIGVIERTREIGMLRAIGSTRRQVRGIVLGEALLLAAMGTAFGLTAGLYLGYVLVLETGAVGYPIPYEFPYAGLVAGTAVGLLFGIVAAILPARQAARMDIVRALRYE